MFKVEDDANTQGSNAEVIQSRKLSGLTKRNFPQQELDDGRIFIRLLYETVTERIKHLDRTAHNLENLILQQQLFGLRVHSC